MLFRKKKGMIDVRELASQGKIVPMGTRTLESDANSDGFVEMGSSAKATPSQTQSTPSTMNFFNTSTPSTTPEVSNSNLAERITALSSKMTKIEQRLEVIEKKLGIGDSSPPLMW